MEQTSDFNPAVAWSTLTVVILGTLLSIIDSTVVSVAMPTIMNVFGIGLSDAQWITTAYTLTMAVVIPLTPYLSKTFGSERVYTVALVIFTASSFLCGFSWNLTTMIAFRILQAIGGGMMSPIGMGLVFTNFPPHKRGVAMGVFGIAAMAAPAFGPTLGGYIVEYFGWRFIFYINIPLGIIAVFLATVIFKYGKINPFTKFDFLGFLSATFASSSILYLLGENENINWEDPFYVYLLIIGIGSLLFFITNELYAESPLLDLRILKNRNFTASILLTSVQMIMMMSISYSLPLFLQGFKGLTAMQAGMVLMPSSLVMALIMPVAGQVCDKLKGSGIKWLIACGLSVSILSTFYISRLINVNASIANIIFVSSIRNIGLGMAMMPSRTLGLADIKKQDTQKATAMQTFFQQYSSSLTVAFVTFLITSRFNANYAHATEQLNSFNVGFTSTINGLVTELVSKGLSVADATAQAMSTLLRGVYVDNYVLAMQSTILTSAIIGILGLLVVSLFKIKEVEPLTEEEKDELKLATIES